MMFGFLICHYTRVRLDAFIDAELSPRVRRRVAQHLDRCPHCDRAYRQRRELRRELQQTLPLVGTHVTPDFAALWVDIRAEIPRKSPPRKFRYGLVMLLLAMALVTPFTMGNGRVTQVLPDQPVPEAQLATETGEDVTLPALQATAVAASTRAGWLSDSPPTMPEPKHEGE